MNLNLLTPELSENQYKNFCACVGISTVAGSLSGAGVAAGVIIGLTAAVAGRIINQIFEEPGELTTSKKLVEIGLLTGMTTALALVVNKVAFSLLSIASLSFPHFAVVAGAPFLLGLGVSLFLRTGEDVREYVVVKLQDMWK